LVDPTFEDLIDDWIAFTFMKIEFTLLSHHRLKECDEELSSTIFN